MVMLEGGGRRTLPAVGESNYQPAIERARRKAKRIDDAMFETTATLQREPKNKYDPNAVQVLLDGRLAAYLSREDAVRFQALLQRYEDEGEVVQARALIVGGDSDRPSLGVFLDVADPGGQMTAGAPQTTVQIKRGGPGCLISLIYFIFVGWWLSGIWISLAWFLNILIITMPIGLKMINAVPKIATLREPTTEFTSVTEGLSTRIVEVTIEQRPFWLRAIYFVLVGWWLSGLWLAVAWIASISLIGLPLAIWMYNRVPAVTTLKRY